MRSYNYFWGVDPGKLGAWAYLDKNSGKITTGIMPVIGNEVDVGPIADVIRNQENPIIVIEKVHSMPKQGVRSMFSFGTSYGKLLGMCQALNVTFDLVLPNAWKKEILQGTKKDKDAAVDYVSRMYREIELIPERCRKPHNGIADAVCILEWGIKNHGRT